MHKAIVSIFFTILAATASASGVEMPFVSAEGRLTGAYQDTVDAAFVCLVLERDGNFQYAFIKTNDTASVLKDLQPLVGRNVSVSGYEKIPEAFNRAVTRRQIMIPSFDDVRAASGGNADMFAVASIDGSPQSFDELSAPSPRKAAWFRPRACACSTPAFGGHPCRSREIKASSLSHAARTTSSFWNVRHGGHLRSSLSP